MPVTMTELSTAVGVSFQWHPIILTAEVGTQGKPIFIAHFETHPGCRAQGDSGHEAIRALLELWPPYCKAIEEVERAKSE